MKHRWFYAVLAVSLVLFALLMLTSLREAHAQDTQYQVTFTATGLDGDAGSNTVLTLGGINYAWNDLPSNITVDETTTFTWASTVSGGSGKQFTYASNDSGLTSPITASGTDVATYNTQYLVTFSSSGLGTDASGNLVSFSVSGGSYSGATSPIDVSGGSIWVDSGASVSYSFVSPVSSTNTGEQYRLESATGATSPITVSDATTSTGVYVTQYQVTFTATGLDSDAGGNTVLTLGGTDYVYYALPSSVYVDSGITFSWTTTVSGGSGKQFAEIGSSGASPVMTTGSYSATYEVQYYVTFDQTGVGSDFTGTVATIDSSNYGSSGSHSLPVSFWWNDGSSHSFSFASPLNVGSKNYAWSTTSGLSTSEAGTLTVSTSGNVLGNYIVQNQVTIDQTGISPDFTGTVVVIDSVSYSQSQLPVSFSWTINSIHNFAFQSPLAVGTNTKQYVWTSTTGLSSLQSDSITVSSYGSIVGTFKTQYYFTVSTQYGSPSPASGWFDSGTSLAELIDSPQNGVAGRRYVCTGWTGTGSTSGTGTGTTVMFTIVTASSITWNWKNQYYLTVTSTYGSPSPTSNWFDAASTLTVSVNSPVAGTSGIRYVCMGWTGTGDVVSTGVSNSTKFTINSPSTITWNWQFQYQLTMSSNFGSTIPSGTNWYTAGSTVTVFASPPNASLGEQYMWNSWTGIGSGSFTGSTTSPTLTMNGPVNETAVWTCQYRLTVSSAHGTPTPNSEWVNVGTPVTETLVGSPSAGSAGTQYVCTGWSGTGNSPASGSSLSVTFTVNTPSTITWNWKTQYQLTISSAYSTTTGSGWYDSGSETYATLAEATVPGSPGIQYAFAGWTGDAAGSNLSSNTITMDAPKTAVAVWVTQYYLTVTSIYSTPSGSGWYSSGSTAYASVTNASITEADMRYVFTGWIGDASGADYSQSNGIIMDSPKTATAQWTEAQVALTILPPLGSVGGYTQPNTGVYPQNDTSPITVAVTSDTGYSFDHWLLDGQNLTDNPITVNMTTDHTLIPVFQPLNFTLTILASNNGTTNPAAGNLTYTYGTNATVLAFPNTGYQFSYWLLDGVSFSTNPITVAIDGNHMLQPVYQLAPSKPAESSQLLIYLYVLGGVFVAAIAVFALIVIIKRRT